MKHLQGPDHDPPGCPPEKLLGGSCPHVLVHPSLARHSGSLLLAPSPLVVKHPLSLGRAFLLLPSLWLEELSFAAPA